jgi:hypothetical protein
MPSGLRVFRAVLFVLAFQAALIALAWGWVWVWGNLP